MSTEIHVRATSTDIEQDMGARILEAIQQQNENFQSLQTSVNLLRDDIGAVKTDINYVRLTCEEIGRRRNRMEKKQSELSSKLQENKSDIDELFDSQENTKNETEKTTSTVQRVEDEMTKLKAEVERLEEFSRRDNLRMYGIPHRRDSNHEDYDTCAQAVTDVLNSVAGPKRWTTDDIVRAHRIGQSRDGQPKPMIVKFNRWKDKMTVLFNRQFRDNLENRGTKVANDLTRNQAAIVAAARRDGKVAFFKKSKLTVEPRRPDSRTYAKVTTADDAGATTNPAQEQSADRVNVGGQTPREESCRDGDSPRVNNSGGERAIPARANRDGAQSERNPGNPDCPTSGIADGHRHGVLATSVKAGTPNLAALSEHQQGDGRTGWTTPLN